MTGNSGFVCWGAPHGCRAHWTQEDPWPGCHDRQVSLVADSSTFPANLLLLHEEPSVQRCTGLVSHTKPRPRVLPKEGWAFAAWTALHASKGLFHFSRVLGGGVLKLPSSHWSGWGEGTEISDDLNVLEKSPCGFLYNCGWGKAF